MKVWLKEKKLNLINVVWDLGNCSDHVYMLKCVVAFTFWPLQVSFGFPNWMFGNEVFTVESLKMPSKKDLLPPLVVGITAV